MAVSLKAIFSGDATPLVKAFKVVEVSANKAAAVVNTDFRKAIEVLQQTSAAAAAAGNSTRFYESQIVSLTRKLRAQEAAQEAVNRANERTAQRQAMRALAMGRRGELPMLTGSEVIGIGNPQFENERRLRQTQSQLRAAALTGSEVTQQTGMTATLARLRAAMSGSRLEAEAARQEIRSLVRTRDGGKMDAERAAAAAQKHAASWRGSLGAGMSAIGGALFNRFMGAGAAIGAAYAGAKLIKDSISVDIQMQRMSNTLKQASGGSVAAASDMQFLREQSDKIGFSFLEAGGEFARFTVAAKASNLTVKETRDIFRQMQEASAVMGLSTGRTSEAMLALEQMLSKGTVMSQELRLQLGNAMPGSMAIFARALGVTQGELMRLVEGGLVPASSAVKLFGLEMERAFTLTDEANKTQRDIVRMTNAINEMKAAIGEEIRPGVSGGAKTVGGIAKFFADPLLYMELHPGAVNSRSTGQTTESQEEFFQRTFDMQDALEKRMRAKRLSGQKKAQDDAQKEREKAGVEKMQSKVSEIDEKREELTRKHSNEMLPDKEKLAALRKQKSDLANFILANRKQMNPVMEAQAKLDLEELQGEVDRAQRGQDLRGHYEKTEKTDRTGALALTDQERSGASLGHGVSLLDVNKAILQEAKRTNALLAGSRSSGVSKYFTAGRQ